MTLSTRNSSEEDNHVVPKAWIQALHDRILTPFVKPNAVVSNPEVVNRFRELDVRARAHATARGEHDALLYLHIYAIWNESLWKVEYDSFEDYCDEWDKMPMGISKSSIKHKIADIKKLLAAGVTPDTIVKSLGNIPMATRSLIKEVFDDTSRDDNSGKREIFDRLPHGTDINKYLLELAELGPIQANMAVDEAIRKHVIYIDDDVEYDPQTMRLFFKVVSRHPETGVLVQELHIPNVPSWAESFLRRRLTRTG